MRSSKRKKTYEIEALSKKWASLVIPKIKEVLDCSLDKKTQKLVHYQIEVGGKRLREVITIASCLACGGKIEDALYPAAGLEILHNCTLIYDDIIDNSNIRRGKSTTWFKFGKSITECVGLDYAASIFQAANRTKYPIEISEIFARTLKIIEDGEILDILFEQSGRMDEKYISDNRYREITEKEYLMMVKKKTASLFQACCQIGGLSAGAGRGEILSLKKYGLNLGIAFQIKDDILDIFGDQKKFGKKIGKDIEERKLGNIVICRALEEFQKKEKFFFLNILRKNKISDKDIKECVNMISKTGAKEKAFLLGEKYMSNAKKELKNLPQNKWNDFLREIADFVIKRDK